jgi:hypothetical protein
LKVVLSFWFHGFAVLRGKPSHLNRAEARRDTEGDPSAMNRKPRPALQEIEPLDGEDMKLAIAREIYLAMQKLGAPMQLLALVGSYGDTLPDEAVLTYLGAHNDTTGPVSTPERRRR